MTRRQAKWEQRRGTVSIEREGKTYRATYRVEDGWITVSAGGDAEKGAHVSGAPPEMVAKMLLTELISEGDAQAAEN